MVYEYGFGRKTISHEYKVEWENGGFPLFADDMGFAGTDVKVIGNIYDQED